MRKTPNAELDRLQADEFRKSEKFPFSIILDNVRSAHNVGSVFRTADAFRCSGIFLCGITAKPPNKEIRKTALGASDVVNWQHDTDTLSAIRQLKQQNYTIIAIEQADESITLANFSPLPDHHYAFIFGHEVKGVSEAVMAEIDQCIEIPQYGTKHSLNIAVSVGVVLWDFMSKITPL